MLKSKRFITLLISMIVFIIGISVGSDPISLGTGITLVSAPYLTAESFRSSNKNNITN